MRLKYIEMTPEALMDLIEGKIKPLICLTRLPKDTRIIDIIRSGHSPPHNSFWLLVESEEFPDLPLSTLIPELNLVYRTKET
jgi:hypothetical protein